MARDVTLVKLGGSLITRKDTPDTARLDVIHRLARELARAQSAGHRLVLGHGSGSFGHPAARRAGLTGMQSGAQRSSREAGIALGAAARAPVAVPTPVATTRPEPASASAVATLPSPAAPDAIAHVQRKAADLHRIVLDALVAAGASPFSVPPSAVAAARDGEIVRFHTDAVRAALDAGLMPVVYGDVVLDTVRGASICSTERALAAVAHDLQAAGWRVRRCIWLGATPGVLADDGGVLKRVSLSDADRLRDVAGDAEAIDVTGGMRHRVDTALDLARIGIPSWIGDGAAPGALARLLAGAAVPGTMVVP